MKRKIYEIIGEAVSFFSFIVFEKDKMNTIKINPNFAETRFI